MRSGNDLAGFTEYIRDKRCILVGPAGYLHGSKNGEWIDSFDRVIRLNWAVPVPAGLEEDIGARSDVLYKRLLKLGKIDFIDLDEYRQAKLGWIVAVDKATDTQNMRAFREVIDGKFPWTSAGQARMRLRSQLSTSPLIGTIAVEHLLSLPIKSLNMTGFDFYETGYYAGYGGRHYREHMDRKEGVIGPTHDSRKNLRHIVALRQKDRRLVFDSVLNSIALHLDKRKAMRGVAVVVPARAASSRFPNKPLALIKGVPMILRVCARLKGLGAPIFVATDSEEIAEVVKGGGFDAIMTGEAMTGTDRVAQALMDPRLLKSEVIVNVQGDEPLVNLDSVLAVVHEKRRYKNSVIGAVSLMRDEGQMADRSVVKAQLDEASGRLVYASREPIGRWKQVGIYAFSRQDLKRFAGRGERWAVEAKEDVEILRFFDLGIPVHMAQVEEPGRAVDLPEHIAEVEAMLR